MLSTRIVSLWDMLSVNNGGFAAVMSHLGSLHAMCLFRAGRILEHGGNGKVPWSKIEIAQLRKSAEFIESLSRELGIVSTQKGALELISTLDQCLSLPHLQLNEHDVQLGHGDLEHIRRNIEYVQRTSRDEFEGRLAFMLKPVAANYLNDFDKLFSEAINQFPDATFDIQEACSSLAFERYTACVFHLMRAVESVVALLADKIGATVANENGETLPWGILVSNIKGSIEKMPKGEHQDAWLKVHSLLHSCNRAYRTQTAHPSAKYTSEEAEAAFHATRSFLSEFAALIKD